LERGLLDVVCDLPLRFLGEYNDLLY